jgi:hypothetical protein
MKNNYFEFRFTSKERIEDCYRDLIKQSEEANHPASLHTFYYYALYRINPYAERPLVLPYPEMDLLVMPYATDKQN